MNFWGWTWFPVNFCWPTVLLPGALFIDGILLASRSYLVTAVIGCLGFALMMYPSNWPILAQFHMPVEKNGLVMTLADLMGFETVRTGTPEYIRLIEKGTLRSFGQDVVPVSVLFRRLHLNGDVLHLALHRPVVLEDKLYRPNLKEQCAAGFPCLRDVNTGGNEA